MIYSSLKPAWYTSRIDRLRVGLKIPPVHVQLILSDLCNQDCHFCAYRHGLTSEGFGEIKNGKYTYNPNRKIPTGKVIEILYDCREIGVEAIQFTGGGEPTVHPDHIKIFDYAHSLGFKLGLVTNGTHVEDYDYSKFEWIRVSLDAGTEETYKSTRKSPLWDRVLDNINKLSKFNTTLGIGFVITDENWPEIEMAALIAEKFADNIRYSAIFDDKEHYENIDEIHLQLKKAKERNVQVIDLFDNRLRDRNSRPDYVFCGMQEFTVYIGGNLKVYRCCNTAYTPHGEIGDLSNQTFKEWFENNSYDGFDARTCRLCQFNEKNELINYLVNHPQHVEFV